MNAHQLTRLLKLSLLAAVLICTPNARAEEDPYGASSRNLLAACSSTDWKKVAYCVGYLNAYRDWYHSLESWHDQILDFDHQYCEPESFDYLVMKDAVVDYLSSHPNSLNLPRIVGVSEALHSRWPCSSVEIGRIQEMLSRLGYYPVDRIDGKLTSRTKASIMQFEQDHGMQITGKPSATLLKAVSSKAEKLLKDANSASGASADGTKSTRN